MTSIRYVLALIFVSVPLSVDAFTPDDSQLTNFIGLTEALDAYGIDHMQVNWTPIEKMCIGLKKDAVRYNRCRFVKATDQIEFFDNQRDCRAGQNPAISQDQTAATDKGDTMNTVVKVNENAIPSYVACMQSLGWKNPSNWRQGRAAEPSAE
jgi:hypothetical protein